MNIATNALTDYLKLIQSHTPNTLIDAAQWRKIETIAQIFPSAVTTFFGFECRLAEPEAKADFLLCADASEAGRRVLATNAYGIDLPKELFQNPVWQQVREFSTNWESEASPLYNNVRNVWLEFDIAKASSHPQPFPIPSAFFGPEPLFATPQDNPHPYTWVWQHALPLLLGRPVPIAVCTSLIRCFEYLPKQAYVFQIGLMLARQVDTVRLCIRDIAPDHIIPYLINLGWVGNAASLHQTLSDLSQMTDRIDLDIDVNDGILSKIGLECYWLRQPKFEARWEVFLDALVKQGLCLPEKEQALLAYPGYIREKTHPEVFPSHARKLSGLLGAAYEWVVFTGLHHIKLVYHNDRIQEAKSYLYVSRSLVSNIIKGE
jgi:hypothetical protein